MIEKVNPSHPDKIADRIAGAIVDLAYKKDNEPKIATEVLIGHGKCHLIIETNIDFLTEEIAQIVERIAGNVELDLVIVPQDEHLAENQNGCMRCGDNGIFKGLPLTDEQKSLSSIARDIYNKYPFDGKYILHNKQLVICQSNAQTYELLNTYPAAKINPLGDWRGGLNVDTGATNRKLGSDMADSITGGGIHGKDLSKADVTLNIYAFLRAQETGKTVKLSCAIGDETIDGKPYEELIKLAKNYIDEVGGFEKLAEWGLF